MGCHQNMADTAFWNENIIDTYGQVSANNDHIDAMTALMDDAVAGSAALVELDTAQTEVQELQAQLAEAAPEAAPAPAPNLTLYVILALLGGLIVGAGGVWLAKKK